jgi:DNA polymerase III sliding clamp (beta) subunit (PCNA family)
VTVPCQHTSPGFSIGFNGGYLASVLDASGGEEILMDVASESAASLWRNPADLSFTAVLMPMRVTK